MQKVRLALCINDADYRGRLSGHLLLQEKERFELHLFTDAEQIVDDVGRYDIIVCADCLQEAHQLVQRRTEPVVYLIDCESERQTPENLTEKVRFIEKFQSVNGIVDAILQEVGSEIRQLADGRQIVPKTRCVAVYSLAENEYQLPFLVTMASVLGEQNRVLILDIQENSGIMHLLQQVPRGGIEEVLSMAESGKYSKSRLLSCIGHMDHADYIYPAENTECLCEADGAMYLRLLQMIDEELDYTMVLLNMGSRFNGFFEVLNRCQNVYLLSRNGGLCQWREYEFNEEISKRGYEALMDRTTRVEIPLMTMPSSCERIVEQWKWNEFGDMIRHMLLQPFMAEGMRA
ncbi:MAG: hypothetical protein MR016_10995 [Agathobacter sp.]|nr:hypothetical protein [Agathobacter sp.]